MQWPPGCWVPSVRTPACAAALPLLAGVLAASVFPEPPAFALVMLCGCLAGALIGFLRNHPGVVIVSIAAGFFSGSWALAGEATREASDPPLRRTALAGRSDEAGSETPVVVEGRLLADAAPGETGVRLRVRAERLGIGQVTHMVHGGVLLTVGGAVSP
jgi:hypothetical protein